MRSVSLPLAVALLILMTACSKEPYKATGRPPATTQKPVTDVIHGVEIIDPYRWLEGDNANVMEQGAVTPEVAAWTDAQNAYTRAVLDQAPGRAAIETRLRELLEVGTVTAPAIRGQRYFYSKQEGKQEQPVIYWREGHRGAAQGFFRGKPEMGARERHGQSQRLQR